MPIRFTWFLQATSAVATSRSSGVVEFPRKRGSLIVAIGSGEEWPFSFAQLDHAVNACVPRGSDLRR
ncbi:hypothetical protein BLA24_10270 [Streptomyces cinnamoneus]|uniref:Uncharacterized protein n=1 Tax=Streptomyces cinnamoneus TaxID=53446 RepID=A0A2G1XLA3_STRCJ|nr:hypothetical protein BLA24_10270 [Streptomyces cinnamoneus]